ncbi:ICP22 family protein [Amycolatopsis aidingensis]|uniref:hypothetical protein n=1 Tax=Amycolatopsis aidingensis TaxID=2842453 RepID=UPI001E4239AB|nr:hypothetical protein [Amycolatopsis aidingensis]
MAGLNKPGTGPSPRPRPRPAEDEQEAPEQPPEEQPSTAEPEPEPQAEAEPETGTEEAEVEQVDALTGEPEPARDRPRPSPRRKARDEGAPKPSSTEEAEQQAEHAERTESHQEGSDGAAEADSTDGAEPAAKPRRSRRSLFRLAALLLVAALAFAALAVYFRMEGNQVSAATNNTALVDVARTAQVEQEVSAAVEKLFSYDFNDIAKTEQAAQELLVNDEVCGQYQRQFAEVKRLAPEQKMVVTTKVTRAAVIMLDGDRAKVLVFVDQTSTRTDQNKSSAGGSQLSVTTELRDGQWKITGLDTYTQEPEPDPNEELPSCS